MNEIPNFEYIEKSEVRRGCSAIFYGEAMYFGGFPNTRQYSIIENCKMTEQTDKMPMHFYDGSCATFLEPTQKVLLCFSSFTLPIVKKCHT